MIYQMECKCGKNAEVFATMRNEVKVTEERVQKREGKIVEELVTMN